MKSTALFDAFLGDTVNLNDTRLGLLDSSFEAIKRFLRDSDFPAKIVAFYKHGSWAHRTIIRPVEGNPFDADVIVFVRPIGGWTAADYINQMARVFRDSATYEDKVRVYSHCVTIEYAGERKMDIAPCVVDREQEETYEVCNRTSNAFQRTEPEKYTAWINDQNALAGRNAFRKVTRLIKYLRDYKTTFTCPSFLLTTLLGMQVRQGDRDDPAMSDVPSALRTLVGRLDDWLQARAQVPAVFNPVLPSEDQAKGWSEEQYGNFRNQIRRYRAWIDDAYAEADAAESLKKWRRVFGDGFGAVRKAVTQTEVAAATATDDVDRVRTKGLLALAAAVLAPSWRAAPRWQPVLVTQKVTIRAKLITFEHGRTMPVSSGAAVEPGQWIQFWSLLGGVAPGADYQTHWRITNTGPVAQKHRALRGGFESSAEAHTRREELTYRGVHMAEAFVVRVADQRLVGHSDPFYVVIE